MAESKIIINRPNSSASPPPNCAICLGSFSNKCFSDSCMHEFCFKCLLEWSKIKAECPLCKQSFRRIIHNVKSNEEYDEHVVEITPPDEIHIIDNEEYLFLPLGGAPQPPTRHHFHFRTTFTVDTRGEHAIQQMLLSHPLMGNGGQISVSNYPSRNIFQRRRRDNTSTSFRRSIYVRNLWVSVPPDVTGRYRDVSPSFFRDCPGARTRLVPWLNRELNALLFENTQLVMHLADIIMEHLLRHHICSRTFRNLLFDYLDSKTDHFIHEFYNFMRSPFDMVGYDRHVIYTERPTSPLPYITLQDEISDDNDSDVIIVGSTNPEEPVIIDLVNSDTDSDEPILVSQEEPPQPIPLNDSPPVPETSSRPSVLPLKLRLKHKRQSREREKNAKQKKRLHYYRDRTRSRSRSTSSSSSSSMDRTEVYERYKRWKKKVKKMIKKRPRSSSTESVNVENTSSDSDVPLSTLTTKKKQLKKYKRTFKHLFKKPKTETAVSNEAKDNLANNLKNLPSVFGLPNANLPSCSRYSSDTETCLDLSIRNKNEDSSGSINAPTCSKYACSSLGSSSEGTLSLLTKSECQSSSDDEYLVNRVVKSEIKDTRVDQRHDGPSSSKSASGSGKKRLRNICIRKEESTNMWYSYPNPNNSVLSDSSN